MERKGKGGKVRKGNQRGELCGIVGVFIGNFLDLEQGHSKGAFMPALPSKTTASLMARHVGQLCEPNNMQKGSCD